MVLDVVGESVSHEEAGILSEQAEQNADEEPFEFVAGIAALFERVVQVAE
jgi:hypothetical protein